MEFFIMLYVVVLFSSNEPTTPDTCEQRVERLKKAMPGLKLKGRCIKYRFPLKMEDQYDTESAQTAITK